MTGRRRWPEPHRPGTYCAGSRVRSPQSRPRPTYPPSLMVSTAVIILAGDDVRIWPPDVDHAAAQRAAADLLRALGVDPVEEVDDNGAAAEE